MERRSKWHSHTSHSFLECSTASKKTCHNSIRSRTSLLGVKLLDDVLSNALTFYPYSVKDGDTAEIIAAKYYGSPLRNWLVFFSNMIIDPYFDMPLKNADLNNNITLKYGSIVNALSSMHHVEQNTIITTVSAQGISNTQTYTAVIDTNNQIATANSNTFYSYSFVTNQIEVQTLPNVMNQVIDLGSTTASFQDGSIVTTDVQMVFVNCYDFEINANEQKRQIRLVDAQYADQIEQQLQTLLGS